MYQTSQVYRRNQREHTLTRPRILSLSIQFDEVFWETSETQGTGAQLLLACPEKRISLVPTK